MPSLFSPFALRDITLRNRICVSPMCQYSAQDGLPSEWHLVHLGARAIGGAALVIAEATAVSPEGRITPDCTGLWSEAHAERFALIARFVKSQGAVPAFNSRMLGERRPLTRRGADMAICPLPIRRRGNRSARPRLHSAGRSLACRLQ